MKKKIFFQFFSVTLVCVILMFSVGLIAVNFNSKTVLKERLAEETQLACSLVQQKDDFDNFKRYENNDAFRVTIFDPNGNVLYESDTKADLENHSDREEIVNALNGTPQVVERYSETFKCKMTYYALKSELEDGSPIVLRLAVKSNQLSSYLYIALPIFISVLIVALIASIVISFFLSKKFSQKILAVGTSLRSLNQGQYQPIKTDSSEPEFYSVLNEINDLNEKTHSHIKNLEAEHKKLNTILDNVLQGIIALDSNNKIVFANKSALKIFDAKGNFDGKEFIYLIDDINVCNLIDKNIGNNNTFNCEYNNLDLKINLINITDNDLSKIIANVLIVTDVTIEKAIAKQKSDFFANASHELKTPVTVLQGLSELLLAKDTLDAQSKKQVARINKESIRLSSLIADMLKLSKLEKGEDKDTILENVNIRAICDEILCDLNEEILKRNLAINIIGSAQLHCDPKKIYELCENLISNAIRYNVDGGKINIEIQDNSNNVVFKVSDTGIGIAKEHLPRLCERFYMVDKSRSSTTGGTGLGLAIVKHICALYNAELNIESELHKGSTFTIKFNK